jgi:hypothetical protein
VLRTRTWLSLRRKLEEQTSDANLISILRTNFEERFRYDEAGVPRVWKPEDDLEAAFTKAKDEVRKEETWLILDPRSTTPLRRDQVVQPPHPSRCTGQRRRCYSLRSIYRIHAPHSHKGAQSRDAFQARSGRGIRRSQTIDGVKCRSDPHLDVCRIGGPGMERSNGSPIQSAILRYAACSGRLSVGSRTNELIKLHYSPARSCRPDLANVPDTRERGSANRSGQATRAIRRGAKVDSTGRSEISKPFRRKVSGKVMRCLFDFVLSGPGGVAAFLDRRKV